MSCYQCTLCSGHCCLTLNERGFIERQVKLSLCPVTGKAANWESTNRQEEVTIPFGKHKGKPISECPIAYLDWLIGQDWLQADLKKPIEDYLEGCAEWHRMKDES